MPEELQIRSFTPDLEVRSSAKGRTVVGIAVPWDVETELDPYLIEGFRRGAFDHQLEAFYRVKLSREHIIKGGILIGRGLQARNDAKGLYVEMLASRTAVGEETLQLVQDGALADLSVAFWPRQQTKAPSLLIRGRDAVWRTKGQLEEVAVVLEGQYARAGFESALGVRSAQPARPGINEAQRVLDEWPLLPPA